MIRIAAGVPQAEDPLNYLPQKPIQEFGKGQIIYGPHQPSDKFYLAVLGRVKVSAMTEDAHETIVRIVGPEGFFGESVLAGGPGLESAVALDSVSVMGWTQAEIERQIEREPRLGIALSQYLVRQCLELQDRIESMAVYKTPERVMIALLQLAKTLGQSAPDGSIRLAYLPHHTIAEYVGTSREIITVQMNRLKRIGLIRYTRSFIEVNVLGLEKALLEQGIPLYAEPANLLAIGR